MISVSLLALASPPPNMDVLKLSELIAEVEMLTDVDAKPAAPQKSNSSLSRNNQTFPRAILVKHLKHLFKERAEADDGDGADEPAACVDYFGWRDKDRDPCMEYEPYCNAQGGYSDEWEKGWGAYEDYGTHGVTALKACCVCGGGRPQLEAMARVADADKDGRISLDEMADAEIAWRDALNEEHEERQLDLRNRSAQLRDAKQYVTSAKGRVRTLREVEAQQEAKGRVRAVRRFDKLPEAARLRAAELEKEGGEEEKEESAEAHAVRKWGGEDAIVKHAETVMETVGDMLASTRRARAAAESTEALMRSATGAVRRGDRVCRTAELADADGNGVLDAHEFLDACYRQPSEE